MLSIRSSEGGSVPAKLAVLLLVVFGLAFYVLSSAIKDSAPRPAPRPAVAPATADPVPAGPAVAPATADPVPAGPDVRPRFHITGCEDGELMVRSVNLWSVPGGLAAGATVTGTMGGDGLEEQGLKCQGAVVVEEERSTVDGRVNIRVTSVVNGATGWVTDSFVGRDFDTDTCAEFFAGYPEAVERCQR